MSQPNQPIGINRDSCYPFDQLQRFGIGAKAIRKMKSEGLPVRYVGRQGFISGDALIDFIEAVGRQVHPTEGQRRQ